MHELAPVKVQDEGEVAEVGPHAELEAWRRLVRLLFRDVAYFWFLFLLFDKKIYFLKSCKLDVLN